MYLTLRIHASSLHRLAGHLAGLFVALHAPGCTDPSPPLPIDADALDTALLDTAALDTAGAADSTATDQTPDAKVQDIATFDALLDADAAADETGDSPEVSDTTPAQVDTGATETAPSDDDTASASQDAADADDTAAAAATVEVPCAQPSTWSFSLGPPGQPGSQVAWQAGGCGFAFLQSYLGLASATSAPVILPTQATHVLQVKGICNGLAPFNPGVCRIQVSDDDFATLAIDQTTTASLAGYAPEFTTTLSLAGLAGKSVRLRLVFKSGMDWSISSIQVAASGEPCNADSQCATNNPCGFDACVGGACQHQGQDLKLGAVGLGPAPCAPAKSSSGLNCYLGEFCDNGSCQSFYGFSSPQPGWWSGCTVNGCSGYCASSGFPSDYCKVSMVLCDDGDPCTTLDQCTSFGCSGALKDCDDSNVCTADACDTATGGCSHDAKDMQGKACNGSGVCLDGACE